MKDILVFFRPASTLGNRLVAASTSVASLASGHAAAKIGNQYRLALQWFERVVQPYLRADLSFFRKPAAFPEPEFESMPTLDPDAITAAMYRRFAVEHLSSDVTPDKRQALILERLWVVHDASIVMIGGINLSLRIVMANSRIMEVTLKRGGRVVHAASFLKRRAGPADVQKLATILAELSAELPDVLIVEFLASGVFDAAAGMVVGELVTAVALSPADASIPVQAAEPVGFLAGVSVTGAAA